MNAGWLALALAVVVLGIGGYTLLVSARERKTKRRIEQLEGKSADRS